MFISLVFSCADWPAYESIISNPQSYNAEDDHRQYIDINWVPIQESIEADNANNISSNGANNHSDTLILNDQGLKFSGTLRGTGWSNSLDTGDSYEFFPYQDGQYLGDVDWIQIRPLESATLCVSLLTDANESTIIDAMVYPLDAQVNPTEPLYDFNGILAGLNQTEFPAEYSLYIGQGRTLGLMISAQAPDNLDIELPYTLFISLMSTNEDGARTPCPIPSEEI